MESVKKRQKNYFGADNREKVIEHVNSFKSFKSPSDDIFPILLKNCVEFIAVELIKIYKYCLNNAITPASWLRIKITFIPKQGKSAYDNPASFRPISLMSFMLKALEKFVNDGMMNRILNRHPRQFASRRENSCVIALNEVMEALQPRMDAGKITLASFLDIEGAFNNIGFLETGKSIKKEQSCWLSHQMDL